MEQAPYFGGLFLTTEMRLQILLRTSCKDRIRVTLLLTVVEPIYPHRTTIHSIVLTFLDQELLFIAIWLERS